MDTALRCCMWVGVALLMLITVTSALDPALREKLRMRHQNNIQESCGVISKLQLTLLDRVCEDCHMMFRIQNLHSLCRINCFQNYYFRSCAKALYQAPLLTYVERRQHGENSVLYD
ncbi:PREDICTED: ion transport peptide-like [Priapulus caudatus]|uniref:Ion transport peptide-like n=1 Tax=Priapulus caudatus TaxID=37621 RepID=A0ABM1FAW0_PRICU|nr:PREDICTED: ion transport peptide-like [Priapulus caudatus]